MMRAKPVNKKRVIVLTVTFAVMAVVLALFFNAIIDNRNGTPRTTETPKPGFDDSSDVQTSINRLDWIIPMPLVINGFSRPGTPLEDVNGIVIHNIGNPGTTAVQNRNFFNALADTQETSVSSNFIIDMDGTIIQCVPVDEVAYASNFRNDDTLSIEVCHPDETGKFTDESYAALIRLTAWLCNAYGLTTDDVLRHYDVYDKECPRYYVENEDAWFALKDDVGTAMS